MNTRVMKALLSGCLLAAWMAPTQAQAQSVNCTGVAQWNASTIYNPGDKLVYQGKLYQAQTAIWNAPPTHCPSCGWYADLGACDGGQNVAPTVSISAPANGASFTAGSNITVSANAQDSDGNVVSVEFFRGVTSLGVDSSAPFSAKVAVP